LLGRKIMKLQGAGFKRFVGEIGAFCARHQDDPELAALTTVLADMSTKWVGLTTSLAARAQANAEEIGAAAVDYLYYSGYLTLAYLWARSVAAAGSGQQTAAFQKAKLDTARFYFTRILPRCLSHQAAIEAGVDSLPEID
jgi:hypothetical protein